MRLGLFDFLSNRRKSRPSKPAELKISAGMRVYAIGDIHGRLDLLDALHDQIVADAATAQARHNVIVYLGDYVDRGLNSKTVLDRLINGPPPEFEKVYLKGNHEAIMLDFLDDSTIGKKWLAIGGNATLLSYGVDAPRGRGSAADFEKVQGELISKLPSAHLAFLESLELTHTIGDYQFVHAGVRPGRLLRRQVERDLIWIREPFLSSPVWHGKVIVHGHSTEWEPEVYDNRIGIDTAAYASGRLTCLILWDTKRAFLFADA